MRRSSMKSNHLRAMVAMAVLIPSSFFVSASFVPTATAAVNPCASGEVWLQPTTFEKLSDGGQLNDYWINGTLNQVPVPPPNFKPLTASLSSLAQYGFPARPTATDTLSAWNREMTGWKPTPDLGLCETNIQATIFQSANWSGYNATTSANPYIGVQGDFLQPTKGSTSCLNSQELSWVGIGGVKTSSLIQDGTGIDTNGSYYAWYEYLDSTGGGITVTKMPSVTVHAGDRIHNYLVHQTAGSGQTTFYVADNTTGTSQSVIVNLSSAYYDGSTAEWIDERPQLQANPVVFAPLANFGTVNWTNAQAQKSTGTWYNAGSQTYTENDMVVSGHYLAFPNTLSSSTSFTDYWAACS